MGKQHYFFRLIPPRTSFAQDMTTEERTLMVEHAAYARAAFTAGTLICYGPVMDPEGTFGIALLEVDSLALAEQFALGDPTIKAGLHRFSLCPMMIAGAQGLAAATP